MNKMQALITTTLLFGISTHIFANYKDGINAYEKRNYQVAFDEFKPLAEQGDVNSQYYLGMLYKRGHIKRQVTYGDIKYSLTDHDKARKWLKKASNQGHANAQNELAKMYGHGPEIESGDKVKAFNWWLKSAKQGNTEAQHSLWYAYYSGTGTTRDYKKAFKWAKKLAEQSGELSDVLGDMYYEGQGTSKNYKEAIKWWGVAADDGSFYARNKLLTKDLDEYMSKADKVEWIRKAAELGYSAAQNNLGYAYSSGSGVLKDDKEAVKWYRKSAEQDNADGQYNLGVMYSNGRGVLKDYKEAVKWYRKAAEQGSVAAQGNLGVMYAKGEGVLKDLSKAKYWIKKAYDNPDAKTSVVENAEKSWNRFELWKY
jgi:TPR repeat protein